jgi:hypothetical protein
MAAGLGFKTFVTGEVLTSGDVNGYLMQGINVFASTAARDAAITSPQEGQFAYTKDTNSLWYYTGSAWAASGATGDIEGVTAGTGITGGGTSGTVTVSFDQANFGGGQFSAGKNKALNGDFTINQRAFTSTTTNGAYGFDRFNLAGTDGTTTYTAQTFTPGAAPVAGYESQNYARLVTTGQTLSSALSMLLQPIEDVRTFANQTVTVSFWAQAGTGTPKIAVELKQNFGTGGSPSADVNTYAGQVTLSTSWARYSVTVANPSISGKTIGTAANSSYLRLGLFVSAGSNFDSRTGSLGIQSNTFNIWGVQVEAGSTATPFQTATGTLQGELAACQRYYYRLDSSGGAYGWTNAIGYAYNTSGIVIGLPLPVQMRVAPTSIDYSGMAVTNFSTDTVIGSLTSISLNASRCTSNHLNVTIAKTSAFTAAATFTLNKSNNTADYIGASAEL